jgi:WD40 repeat protein
MAKASDEQKPTASQEPKDQLQEPKRLGGFELLARLGKGGMGTVFKARQVSMARLVALKILPKEVAENETFVQRFLREARSAAQLRHPNIVQAFDVGQADGYYFFAMEFVDGETLEALVRRDGPLEPNRALDIMKQVTSALAAAHEAGIVHRDIKPSNIMLDKKGEVRVADFGLAKHTEGDVEVTADGSVVGTPAYFAPETAKGDKADHRSDLYSLGATVFCALAGRPPFDGKSFAEVIAKKVTEDSPPLASLAPRVDRRLCHIIDRLLRKNPEARYPSAKALLDDLNGLGKLQSVAAAARAEGRSMIAEAPTLEMTEGKRREREARIEAHRPRSNRTTLIAVGAIVAILAIVGIAIATRKPKDSATTPPKVGKLPDPKPGLPDFFDDEEAKLKAEGARMAKARQQYDDCVRAADAALARKDYETARAAMRPALSLGVPGLGELARTKLAEIDALEKKAAGVEPGEWVSLFDGKTLDGWRVEEQGGFGKHGKVALEDGQITLDRGDPFTGLAWTRGFPALDYEVELEAKRVTSNADFASITFPVGSAYCTFHIGAWWDKFVGLSKVDDRLCDQNETGRNMGFQNGRWYRFRVRVARERIQCWIDDEAIVDFAPAGHKLSPQHGELKPFGVCSWQSSSALRNIRLRRLGPGPEAVPAVVAQIPDKPGEWVSLFDGKALDGWRVAAEGDFARHGQVRVEEGRIVLDRGGPRTGIAYLGALPTTDYEVALEARRESGSEMVEILFPLAGSHCVLHVGSWDGRFVGLSLIDGRKAPDNETARRVVLETMRWYRVRLRVTEARIRAWLDDKLVVDLPRAGRGIAPAPQLEPARPLGIACFETGTGVRNIRFQRVEPEPAEPPPAIAEPPEAGPPPELPSRPGEWCPLFDGKSLSGWRVAQEGQFARRGNIRIADGGLVLERGSPRTGIAWTGKLPTSDYELALEARREPESESLCDLLFPVGSSLCTLNVGAWGMNVVGLSRVDGREVLDNAACTRKDIEAARWYRLRLQVTAARVEAWLDDEKLIDLPREVARLTPEPAIYPLKPLGLATWQGKSTFRNFRLRRLEGKPEGPPVGGSEIRTATVPVSAEAQWFDTGLYVSKGSEYTLSATGRWGHCPVDTNGPEGRREAADEPSVLPGAPAHCLVGRLGTQGRPFLIGASLDLTPAESGRLHLCINDWYGSAHDNWGSLRVTVTGPLVADKAAPLLSRFTKVVKQVQVDARGDWTPAGIELQRGDVVLITATGRWNGGAGLGETDANGIDRKSGALRLGALAGRIGKDGERFTLGALHLLEAQESGALHLAMHDTQRFDNEGSLTVTIASSPELDQLRKKREAQADVGLRLLHTLRGHVGWVVSVAFSPNGAQVATTGRDATVKLWDAATGECLKTLRGHLEGLETVAFSPEGQRLLSSGWDKTVRLWDVATGACLKTLQGHTAEVFSVAFLRDGKSAISGSADGQIRIWDLGTGDCLKTLTDLSGPMDVRFALPLPDGKRVLSAGGDGAFRLWDVGAGTCVRKWNGGSDTVWGLGLSTDGERIVAAGYDPPLRAWNVATGALLKAIETRRQNRSVAFSPDGRWMATGCYWGVIEFWDAARFEKVRTVQAHNGAVWKLAFSPDSKRLAAASFDGTATVWELTPTPKKPD